ncbi:kinase-like domain-containing protein [Aspergillus heterothallicus]
MKFLLSQRSLSRLLRTWGPRCSLSPTRCSNLLLRPVSYRGNSTLTYTPNPFNYDYAEWTGETGRTYTVNEVVRELDQPFRRTFFASSDDGKRVVLKYIQPENFDNHLDVNDRLQDLDSHIRLAEDLIPDTFMVVYEFCPYSSLDMVKQIETPLRLLKKILKSILSILAELHDRDIVHGVFKKNNIFIDLTKNEDTVTIDSVQLTLSEDIAHVHPGSNIVGKSVGSRQWNSPEAYAMGPVNKPSDIFAFALICLFVVQRMPMMADTTDDLNPTDSRLHLIDNSVSAIEHQMSLFADKVGLRGFLDYLGRNHPMVPLIELAREGFNVDRPREPFSEWEGLDEDFKDLILKMTNFDPNKRITARQALDHKWFEGVEVTQQYNSPKIQDLHEESRDPPPLAIGVH